MTSHCLSIAGSDPGGGAGIQGDLKTFAALGAYGMAVITALTAQNSLEVRGVHSVPPDFVRLQLRTVFDDIRVDAAKTGMLATADIIDAVADELAARVGLPVVVDPVMVSSSGARLLAEDAVEAVRRRMMPLAAVATPNAPEAAVLAGFAVESEDDARRAAEVIHAMGAKVVVVKGGDVDYGTGEVLDIVFDGREFTVLRASRLRTGNTHGSGCAMASAICVGLALGLAPLDAIQLARRFVRAGIEASEQVGAGPGPVNHLHGLMPVL